MSAEAMQVLAETVDDYLNGKRRPRRVGFAIFVFPFDQPHGARTNYVSNADRATMIAAMKEVVARFEGRGHDAPELEQ